MRQIAIVLLVLGTGLVLLGAVQAKTGSQLAAIYAEMIADEFALELDHIPEGALLDYPTARRRLVALLNVFAGKRTGFLGALYLGSGFLAASAVIALTTAHRKEKLQPPPGKDA